MADRKRCPFCAGFVQVTERTAVHEGPECAQFAELRAHVQNLPDPELLALSAALNTGQETGKA